MLDENEWPTPSESMALTQMNNLNEEDLERGLMPNDVEERENIEGEDNYLRGLKSRGIKKYFLSTLMLEVKCNRAASSMTLFHWTLLKALKSPRGTF